MPSPTRHTQRSPLQLPEDRRDSGASSAGPSIDSDITWLLHRAAQRMRGASGDQAEKHGIALRDYIVLSALHLTPNLTQVELGKALGLDKTTLMTQLDQLEHMGLIIRRTDPRDRRARVAADCADVQAAALDGVNPDQVKMFRRILFDIIGDSQDPGSCL